jgi:hypothetical protein
MSETKPTPTENLPAARRGYDAAFKQSAVAHRLRHGGDRARTAS